MKAGEVAYGNMECKCMKISAKTKETKSSLGRAEKERIDLIIKKSFDGWWHCRYKYTSIKNGMEISLSCEWSCKDEFRNFYRDGSK